MLGEPFAIREISPPHGHVNGVGVRARGTVAALDWQADGTFPVVEFTPSGGTPRRFRDSSGSDPSSYEVGEQVEVLYRADSPGDARINGFLSLWLGPVIVGGIGLLFTGAGTVMALVSRRLPCGRTGRPVTGSS
ncbi:DUF3592 domain-containing protein [Streptomyces hesseae]|uniref:DUF3592 domain-containing protein n=1 Tax=Streptomyces hesseae TaxID=3075519 RepID=A0ABU2SXL6_9ACTN|nr:DUF3592 domain-containing protein [Streptomyces sp. DSM 40473]MDT0453748.1 DUF3592 domain-containing protein [Streptomyces sp. DSM 40473]